MSEPTLAEVRAAVLALPAELQREFARGPLRDPDDPDACRICDHPLFDSLIYTGYDPPWAEAGCVLLDYHRFYADDGRSAEAYRRCLRIYRFAREAVFDHAFGDPPFDLEWYWRAKLPERKGEPCRVLARGGKGSVLVEFEDGYRVVTSRHAVRRTGNLTPREVPSVSVGRATSAARPAHSVPPTRLDAR